MCHAFDLDLKLAGQDIANLLGRAAHLFFDAAVRLKCGMDHLEIIGQVGGQQFLNQSFDVGADGAARVFAHDETRFMGGGCSVAE